MALLVRCVPQAQEQTISQTLRTLPGALLREDGTPGLQQFMEFLQ
jgi:hypothetical protein